MIQNNSTGVPARSTAVRPTWEVAASQPAIFSSGRGARISMPAKESDGAIWSTLRGTHAFSQRRCALCAVR
ncbi:hypothetical protein [Streptomyces bottropensis]|uniref:hypothetical protein n=1 Tax=Streptomyces bottropensis TaxID=42235 RepID=UPI0036A9C255